MDFIELPAKLPSGEKIIYSKGAKQKIDWSGGGKKTKNNQEIFIVKNDLSKFTDTFTYTTDLLPVMGNGMVKIKVDSVGVAIKQKANGSPIVMIEAKGFKVEITKQGPAKDPKPMPPLIDSNSIGAPILADAKFSISRKSNVKGTD